MAVAGWLMKEENQRLGSKIVLLTDDISSPGWYAADDSSIQIATSSTTSYFTSPHNFLDRELQTYVPGECPRLSNPCTLWSHNTRELTSEGATHFLNKLLEGLNSQIELSAIPNKSVVLGCQPAKPTEDTMDCTENPSPAAASTPLTKHPVQDDLELSMDDTVKNTSGTETESYEQLEQSVITVSKHPW